VVILHDHADRPVTGVIVEVQRHIKARQVADLARLRGQLAGKLACQRCCWSSRPTQPLPRGHAGRSTSATRGFT
jgi:hypothetical protein